MLKPLKSSSLKKRQAEFLEGKLLEELSRIEKEVGKLREDEPVDSLLQRYKTIMNRLQIVWKYLEVDPGFSLLYGSVLRKGTSNKFIGSL
jgi:hypothetical protein